MNPGTSTALYSFTATAGTPLNLVTADPNGALDFRLVDPFGNQAFGPQRAGQQLLNPVSGTYTLIVEGQVTNGSGADPFTITATPVPHVSAALTGLDSTHGPFSVAGKVGTALAFTGLDSISVPDGPATNLGTAFTVDAWVNPDNVQSYVIPILAKIPASGQPTYAIEVDNGDRIRFAINDGTNSYTLYTNYGVLPGDTWTHVAATLDPVAGLMTIYLDGVQVAQQSYGAFNPPVGGVFYVAPPASAVSGASATFEGSIDDVRLWTAALTQSQIAAQMGAPLTGTEPGLALYLPLDEASGAAAVADKGPNAAAATVQHAFDGLPNVIEGRIGSAYETDTYSFSLAQPASIVLDALSDDDAFTVTIAGPNGFSFTRTLDRVDAFNQYGNPVLAMPAGNYTLSISAGNNAHVGPYALRLLDLATATPVSLNTPVSAVLPAGFATAAYSFTAAAGTQLLFSALQIAADGGQVAVRLLDSAGRQVWGPENFTSHTDLPVLSTGGTYTLLVEGNPGQRTGPVPFIFALDTLVTRALSLTVGAPNPSPGPVWGGAPGGTGLTLTGADEVDVPNSAVTTQTGSLTLEVTARIDRMDNTWVPLAVESNPDGSNLQYALYVRNDGAIDVNTQDQYGVQGYVTNGGLIARGTFYTIGAVIDRLAGTVTIYLNGTAVGSTAIRTTPGVAATGPLVLGASNEAQPSYSRLTGVLGAVRLWSVARSAADMLASANAAPGQNSAGLVLDLPFTEGSGTVANNVAAAGGQAALVGLNTDGVTGNLARPGESDAYAFSLTQPTRIVVDALSGNPSLRWTITGPYGAIDSQLFTNTQGYDQGGDPVLVLPAGNFTFTVSADTGGFGAYNIRLVDIDAKATALTLGTQVNGVLQPADQDAAYSFQANANDNFFFNAIGNGGEVTWRLIGPDGQQYGGPRGFNDASVLLPLAGKWTVLIEARAADSARFTYAFTPIISPTVTAPLTLGATVTGSIVTPSETDAYTFTLAAAAQLVFDSLANDNDVFWTLTGPTGTVVNQRGFASSDSGNIGGSTILSLGVGNYTLSVQRNGDHVGGYAFRLLDAAAGAAVSADTPVTGTLGDNGKDTDAYRFTATAGERVVFHGDSNSSPYTVWRLLDPYGNLVFGPNALTTSGPLTLVAGAYTLLVEGNPGQTGGASYGFTIDSLPVQTAGGATTQDFDTAGLLPYTLGNFSGAAASLAAGATGNALQLTSAGIQPQDNAAYFPVTTDGPLQQIQVDFDFTIDQHGGNRGSGLVVALLDEATWGASGIGADLFTNAGLANSLAIAFDTNNDYGGDGSSNHIAIRGGGGLISQQFVTPGSVDLGSGTPVHATITVAQTDGGELVSVVLTPQGGTAFTAVSNLFVAGYSLQATRVAIGGANRYGTADQSVDNVAIARGGRAGRGATDHAGPNRRRVDHRGGCRRALQLRPGSPGPARVRQPDPQFQLPDLLRDRPGWHGRGR